MRLVLEPRVRNSNISYYSFGVEKHDDIADAFSLLINSTLDKHANESTWIISFLGGDTVYFSDYFDVG